MKTKKAVPVEENNVNKQSKRNEEYIQFLIAQKAMPSAYIKYFLELRNKKIQKCCSSKLTSTTDLNMNVQFV